MIFFMTKKVAFLPCETSWQHCSSNGAFVSEGELTNESAAVTSQQRGNGGLTLVYH